MEMVRNGLTVRMVLGEPHICLPESPQAEETYTCTVCGSQGSKSLTRSQVETNEIRVKAVLYLKNAYLTVRQIAELVNAYYDYIGPDWDDKEWPSGRYSGRVDELHNSLNSSLQSSSSEVFAPSGGSCWAHKRPAVKKGELRFGPLTPFPSNVGAKRPGRKRARQAGRTGKRKKARRIPSDDDMGALVPFAPVVRERTVLRIQVRAPDSPAPAPESPPVEGQSEKGSVLGESSAFVPTCVALVRFRLPWYHPAAPYEPELLGRPSDEAPPACTLTVPLSESQLTTCYFIFGFFKPLHYGNMLRMGTPGSLGEAAALLQRTFHPDRGGNFAAMVVVTGCVQVAMAAASVNRWSTLVDAYLKRLAVPDAPRPGQSQISFQRERLYVRELFLDSQAM